MGNGGLVLASQMAHAGSSISMKIYIYRKHETAVS